MVKWQRLFITVCKLLRRSGRRNRSNYRSDICPGIHIVGGGANAEFLNRLTAKYTKKKIYAGPTEATALGNISVQMIAAGEFADLKETRKCIFDSFEIKLYEA